LDFAEAFVPDLRCVLVLRVGKQADASK